MRVPWRRLTWVLIAVDPDRRDRAASIWVSTRDLSRYQARLDRTDPQGDRPRAGGQGAAGRQARQRARHGGRRRHAVECRRGDRGPSWRGCASSRCIIDPFSLFLGEIKIGRVAARGRRHPGRAQRRGRHQPRDAAAARRLGAARRREPVVPTAHQPGLSLDRHHRRARLGPDHRRRTRTSAGRARGAERHASGRRRPTSRCRSRVASPPRRPRRSTSPARPGRSTAGCAACPATSTCRAASVAARSRSRAASASRAPPSRSLPRGPTSSVFGPYIRLPVPSGGPYVLTAKAATQRSAFKVEVTTLKVGSSELTGDVLFRVDRKGTATITVNADVNRLNIAGLHAAPAGAAPASAASPAQPRLVPTVPFSASWLGRSTLSVTARLGEVVGLGQQGAERLDHAHLERNALCLPRRRLRRQRIGGLRSRLRSDRAHRAGDTDGVGQPRAVGGSLVLAGLRPRPEDAVADIDLRLRGGGRTTRDALNVASGSIDIAVAKGTWPRDALAGWPAETQRLLGGSDSGVPFNCIAGRFDVSGGVAIAAAAGRRHAARDPGRWRLRPSAQRELGIHPGARGARQPERSSSPRRCA